MTQTYASPQPKTSSATPAPKHLVPPRNASRETQTVTSQSDQTNVAEQWQQLERQAKLGHHIGNYSLLPDPDSMLSAQGRRPDTALATRPNRTGLPDRLKFGIESLSGISLDNVKVHYNSNKPAELNAMAYAQGADIHVGPGQEKHLPHEAWHVIQQAQDRVKPTNTRPFPLNDEPRLEDEATVMGATALKIASHILPSNAPLARFISMPPIQRTKYKNQSGKWHQFSSSSNEPDIFGLPDISTTNEGDIFNCVTGTFENSNHSKTPVSPKKGNGNNDEQLARDRLVRWGSRSERRQKARKRADLFSSIDFSKRNKKTGTRLEVGTPFGKMRFGRGKFNVQPFGTLDREDWGPGYLPPVNYDSIHRTLGDDVAVYDEILGFLSNSQPVRSSRRQLPRAKMAAATALSSLLSVAEPHRTRNPAAGKLARAAIRRAHRIGGGLVFNRKDGHFVPAHAKDAGAKQGGTGALKDMISGDKRLSKGLVEMVINDASESSEDSSPKKKKKK